MRSILLQLHIGKPVRCESWANAPVAHGVQVTVYAESGARGADVLAQRAHAAIERELASLNAYREAAPCKIQDNRIFEAHTCAGAVAGLARRVLIFVADGNGTIDPEMETYFKEPGTLVVPIVDKSIAVRPQT